MTAQLFTSLGQFPPRLFPPVQFSPGHSISPSLPIHYNFSSNTFSTSKLGIIQRWELSRGNCAGENSLEQELSQRVLSWGNCPRERGGGGEGKGGEGEERVVQEPPSLPDLTHSNSNDDTYINNFRFTFFPPLPPPPLSPQNNHKYLNKCSAYGQPFLWNYNQLWKQL